MQFITGSAGPRLALTNEAKRVVCRPAECRGRFEPVGFPSLTRFSFAEDKQAEVAKTLLASPMSLEATCAASIGSRKVRTRDGAMYPPRMSA